VTRIRRAAVAGDQVEVQRIDVAIVVRIGGEDEEVEVEIAVPSPVFSGRANATFPSFPRPRLVGINPRRAICFFQPFWGDPRGQAKRGHLSFDFG
jgi:hypothetical protein